MKTSGQSSLEKIYLSLYLKGWCVRGSWRPNRTTTYLPPLLWPQQRFFPVLLGCSTGDLGAQPLWGMVLIPASSLQLIWSSEFQLLSRGSGGPPLLGAGSLYNILSPTDLNFRSSGLFNNLTPTILPASATISLSIQPVHSQGYILICLDRMHMLFTQVHFLFWQLGRVGGQYATVVIPIFKIPVCHTICRGLDLVRFGFMAYQPL